MILAVVGSIDAVHAIGTVFHGTVLVHVPQASMLVPVIRANQIDAVWIASGSVAAAGLPFFRKLVRYPTVPIILSGYISRQLAENAIELGQWTNPQIVLDGFDDNASVRTFLGKLPPASTLDLLIFGSREQFALLPPRIEAALVWIAREPLKNQTVEALVKKSGYSPQYVRRCMRLVGLRSPHLWLDAVRAIYLWSVCRDSGFTVTDVTRKLGRTTFAPVNRLWREFLGSTSREDVRNLNESETLRRIEKALWGTGATARTP